MRRDTAALIIGVGVEIIVTIVGVEVKNIPVPLTIIALTVGLSLIIYGALSMIKRKKRGNMDKNKGEYIDQTVTSYNQQGGQTAREIYNFGQQTRTFQNTDVNGLVSELSPYAGTEVIVATLGMDSEIKRFTQEIRELLRKAGWKVAPQAITLMASIGVGVILQSPDALPASLEALENGLRQRGFRVSIQTHTKNSTIQILVGSSQ